MLRSVLNEAKARRDGMKKGWAFSAFVAGIALITGTPAYPASYQAAIDLSKGTADQKRTNTYTGQFDVTIQFRGSHLSTDAEMDIGGSPGIPPEGKRIEKWCNVMLSGVVTGYLVGTLEVQDRSSKTSLAPEAGSSRFGFSGYSNRWTGHWRTQHTTRQAIPRNCKATVFS